jgi:hypothetical protein
MHLAGRSADGADDTYCQSLPFFTIAQARRMISDLLNMALTPFAFSLTVLRSRGGVSSMLITLLAKTATR